MKNSVTLDKKKENQLKREMLRVAEIFLNSSNVVELRALNVPSGNGFTRTWSGYFDNALALAKEAFRLDQLQPQYVSLTINSVNPALLARSSNKTKPVNRGDSSTNDNDIIRRCWLVIDLDPVRPSGISSTELEKEMARRTTMTMVATTPKFGRLTTGGGGDAGVCGSCSVGCFMKSGRYFSRSLRQLYSCIIRGFE